MATSRLHELSAHGVSVWIDSLSREMLATGELERLIEEDAVVGVTSNPTIFEKALSTGGWYDEQLRATLERHDDPKEIFLELAVDDIQGACDLLKPVWERTGGVDGYVSLEVDPALAYDREGDAHYDHISAFIKSMRGSDPDAAVYWLVRMLEAGEDARYIARRMVVHAAEDVGLADPRALRVALDACETAANVVGNVLVKNA